MGQIQPLAPCHLAHGDPDRSGYLVTGEQCHWSPSAKCPDLWEALGPMSWIRWPISVGRDWVGGVRPQGPVLVHGGRRGYQALGPNPRGRGWCQPPRAQSQCVVPGTMTQFQHMQLYLAHGLAPDHSSALRGQKVEYH